MILVVDSDEVFSRALIRVIEKLGETGQMSGNAIQAMELISAGEVPEMIFLEIYLTGPDGFTFLNELASYPDTMKVPVVVVSDGKFSEFNLEDYGVVRTLNKETMRPEDIKALVNEYTGAKNG